MMFWKSHKQRDEELQQNAAAVGDHLAGRLRELGERHPLIGAVHGMGGPRLQVSIEFFEA